MIFPGPAFGLGHPARAAVTGGLGVSSFVFAPVDEVGPSQPTYPSRDVLDQIIGDYPDQVQPGHPPLEAVGEMYLTQEQEIPPTSEVEWYPTQPRGNLIDTRGTCGPRLNRKSGPTIGRRKNRLPKRRK